MDIKQAYSILRGMGYSGQAAANADYRRYRSGRSIGMNQQGVNRLEAALQAIDQHRRSNQKPLARRTARAPHKTVADHAIAGGLTPQDITQLRRLSPQGARQLLSKYSSDQAALGWRIWQGTR